MKRHELGSGKPAEETSGSTFYRFTGALGVAMASFRGGHAPQTFTEAGNDLMLAGVPADVINAGIETALGEQMWDRGECGDDRPINADVN